MGVPRDDEGRDLWVDNWLDERRKECAALRILTVAEWKPVCMSCGGQMAQGTDILLDASGEEFCSDDCFDRRHRAAALDSLVREEQNDAMERSEGERR